MAARARGRARATTSSSTARAPAAGTPAARPTSARRRRPRRRGIALEGAARQVAAERLRRLRPARRDGPRQPATICAALAPDEQARAKVRLLREFDPASADGDPTSRTRTTAASAASSTCSTWSQAACRGPARADPRERARRRESAPRRARASRGLRRVGGGDINEAIAVVLADGARAFVKTRADAAPGEYAAEAAGLRWLAEPGALRMPQVLEVADGLPGAGVDRAGRARRRRRRGARARAGRAARRRRAGLRRRAPGQLARRRAGLPNDAAGRLAGVLRRAAPAPAARSRASAGARAAGAAASSASCERIAELAGPPEPPARLHGDLWSGNVLAGADGRPWLIDPVGLRRPPRGRPGDAARCSARPAATRVRRLRGGRAARRRP